MMKALCIIQTTRKALTMGVAILGITSFLYLKLAVLKVSIRSSHHNHIHLRPFNYSVGNFGHLISAGPEICMTSVEDMNKRIDLKNEACRKLNVTKENVGKIGKRHLPYMAYVKDFNLSYCSVGKAGGTFIKQLFLLLVGTENETDSIESSSRLKTHGDTYFRFTAPYENETLPNFKQLVVARNPFSRLYSAYIDRVSMPSQTGPIREGAWCFYDVTFEDFLKIVVNNTDKGYMELHWSPIYHLCHSCDVDFTYIVRHESFNADVRFIIDSLRLRQEKRDVVKRKLDKPRMESAIQGVVKDLVESSTQEYLLPGCIGWYRMCQRIWYAFQVQGYIKEGVDLPKEISDTPSGKILLETIFKAIKENPMTQTEIRLQRNRLLASAYKSVSKKTIEEIKRVFKADFEMFGYSTQPPV